MTFGFGFSDYQSRAHSTSMIAEAVDELLNAIYMPYDELRKLTYGHVEEEHLTALDNCNVVARATIKQLLCHYYAVLGLCGEVGEIANKAKKVIRDQHGAISKEYVEDIGSELGDVQWYVSETAESLNLLLEMVAQGNIRKLADRKKRGRIQGSGDER